MHGGSNDDITPQKAAVLFLASVHYCTFARWELFPSALRLNAFERLTNFFNGHGFGESLRVQLDFANPLLRSIFPKNLVQEKEQNSPAIPLRNFVKQRMPDGDVDHLFVRIDDWCNPEFEWVEFPVSNLNPLALDGTRLTRRVKRPSGQAWRLGQPINRQ